MESLLLSLVMGFGIGGSLGLLGGGGSILTVPVLVYLIGQTPQVAVTTSLVIVGANSLMGAYFHRAQGTLNWRVALIFGGVGMVSAYLTASMSNELSPQLLMVLFAILMLMVGGLLLFRRAQSGLSSAELHIWKVVLGGVFVGAVTGILGVGGGFLIVPALVMLVGLPMHHAVGTSLLIIAMNSLAGVLGHMGHINLDLRIIVIFVISGFAGSYVGTLFSQHLDPRILRRAFAMLVIVLAVLLLADNVPALLV